MEGGGVYEEALGWEGVVGRVEVKGWGGENEESPVVEVEARRGWEGPAMQVFRTETELILVAR